MRRLITFLLTLSTAMMIGGGALAAPTNPVTSSHTTVLYRASKPNDPPGGSPVYWYGPYSPSTSPHTSATYSIPGGFTANVYVHCDEGYGARVDFHSNLFNNSDWAYAYWYNNVDGDEAPYAFHKYSAAAQKIWMEDQFGTYCFINEISITTPN